tara:strand:- start:3516 stop:3950 length:435 start_codon:yes stop_codon:yes gene_type:complete
MPVKAGRGQKHCPKCKKIIGARSQSCKYCKTKIAVKVSKKISRKTGKSFTITEQQIQAVLEIVILYSGRPDIKVADIEKMQDLDLGEELAKINKNNKLTPKQKETQSANIIRLKEDAKKTEVLSTLSSANIDKILEHVKQIEFI